VFWLLAPEIARTVPDFISGAFTGLLAGGVLASGLNLVIEWSNSDPLWLKSFAYGALIGLFGWG
jgi:hypothetical protein